MGVMKDTAIRILGVHPLKAEEPVWLVEVEIDEKFEEIDWGSITQPNPRQDQSYWQVPYDERTLGKAANGKERAAFFFHYLELDRPLESAYGQLMLPPPTSVPDHLRFMSYEAP